MVPYSHPSQQAHGDVLGVFGCPTKSSLARILSQASLSQHRVTQSPRVWLPAFAKPAEESSCLVGCFALCEITCSSEG
jgi:hypothetical protein